jgi:hypothetical protein
LIGENFGALGDLKKRRQHRLLGIGITIALLALGFGLPTNAGTTGMALGGIFGVRAYVTQLEQRAYDVPGLQVEATPHASNMKALAIAVGSMLVTMAAACAVVLAAMLGGVDI